MLLRSGSCAEISPKPVSRELTPAGTSAHRRLYAQVDFRREVRPIAVVDPGTQFGEIEFGKYSSLWRTVGEMNLRNILRTYSLHTLTKLSPSFHPLCIEHFSIRAQSRTHLEPLLP